MTEPSAAAAEKAKQVYRDWDGGDSLTTLIALALDAFAREREAKVWEAAAQDLEDFYRCGATRRMIGQEVCEQKMSQFRAWAAEARRE